jgi:hypothetical protein
LKKKGRLSTPPLAFWGLICLNASDLSKNR